MGYQMTLLEMIKECEYEQQNEINSKTEANTEAEG